MGNKISNIFEFCFQFPLNKKLLKIEFREEYGIQLNPASRKTMDFLMISGGIEVNEFS